MKTLQIGLDLKKSLQQIDKNDYVLNSMVSHLEEQCTDEEVKMIEGKVLDLDVTDYESEENFISDYQPIFDLVEFPIAECFRMMNKRKLNYDAL